MFRFVLVYFLIFTLLSCSSDDSQLQCEDYYLHKIFQGGNSTTLSYNSDGLLSKIIESWANSPLEFFYENRDKLVEVNWGTGKSEFKYDPEGRLIATIRIKDGQPFDSLALIYDDFGRITKMEIFTGPSNYEQLESYDEISYPSHEKVIADFYNRNGDNFIYSGTFTYVLDGKPKPYPREYYLYLISFTNIFLSSNPNSLTITGPNPNSTTNYEYTYNTAGYPIHENYYDHQYQYQCEPPLTE